MFTRDVNLISTISRDPKSIATLKKLHQGFCVHRKEPHWNGHGFQLWVWGLDLHYLEGEAKVFHHFSYPPTGLPSWT